MASKVIQAAAARRHVEEQIALDEMATAALLVDESGRVTLANRRAIALLGQVAAAGLSLAELLAQAGIKGQLPPMTREGAPAMVHMSDGNASAVHVTRLSIGGSIITFEDVSAYLRDAEMARLDALTGLANRITLSSRLGDLLGSQSEVTVACLDLDRFKTVNDTLGHPMGDALLRKVAERLQSVAREEDLVARLGGDEFGLLLPEASPEEAERVAARIVDLVGRAYLINGHQLNVGVSVGVARAPADGASVDALLKNADLALYRAKAEGRGTFRFFETSMDALMQERRALEIDLRRAMALRELHLVYQPQMRLESNEITGFEALLRWDNPRRGLVSPAEFIPLAEETGLIGTIGEWVLRTACMEAASWAKPVSVAVNVSALQFRRSGLVEAVTSALAYSGLDPSRLELEITEGALLEDTGRVVETLLRLRALGVRVSMDDFGTGYSSLSYLQKFPFDKIKIDQSFVRGMMENPECGAIVRAVAGLGASLGIRTTAEGVETAEQLAAIRAEGCTEVQGYFTGRPLSAQAATALLTDSKEGQ
jgi:diguanylate cyclase (GGDEF)-like protein